MHLFVNKLIRIFNWQQYVNHKVRQVKKEVGGVFQKDNKRRADDHYWPWDIKPHNDKWIDADVPFFGAQFFSPLLELLNAMSML